MMKIGRFAITIMALMASISVSAQDFDKKNLLYRVSSTENKTVELVGFEKKPKEELVIPDEVSYKGDKYVITSIAENAFKNCENLKSVIGSNIQLIKDRAFQGCINLSSATFTDQLSEVKNHAFQGCTSLSQVSLGNNVQTIGDAAFQNCSSLTEFSFGSGLKSLGKGVINGTKISSIVLPNSLVKIGHHAFADCNQLSSVTFGNALTHIENNAFEKTSISTIVFPNTLLYIGDKAFANCTNLLSITYGNSLKEIGTGAFQGVPISSLSFPTSLKIINDNAFKDCKSLQSISLNDNIEAIKESAFENCSLLSVDLTDCMADVYNNAFKDCKNVIISSYSLKGIANYINRKDAIIFPMPKADRRSIEYFIKEKDEYVIALGTFKNGFAFFHYKDGNDLKCDVVTLFGKVISQKGGKIVAENLIMVPSDNGSGVVLKDARGRVLTKTVYDNIYDNNSLNFTEGCLRVCKNGKYGFIDKSGNEVIPCKYSGVEDFKNDIAIVWGDGRKYDCHLAKLIDKGGKSITPCEILYNGGGHSFNDNNVFLALECDKKYGIIDKHGNTIVPFVYDYAYNFSEGLAAVCKDGRWGFVDQNNKMVIPFEYEYDTDEYDTEYSSIKYGSLDFREGLACIIKNGKWGYIDKANNVVIPFIYSRAEDFHGGIAYVENSDGMAGCIDTKGKVVQSFGNIDYLKNGIYMTYTNQKIYGNYENILFNKSGIIGEYSSNPYIYDSLIIVEKNKKYGAIDYKGKVLIPCKYNQLSYSDNILRAKDDNGRYIFNGTGKMIVSSDYETDYDYYGYEGILKVKKDNLYGFIDKTGKVISSCIYDEAEEFQDGFAIVCKGEKWGVIDRNGKEAIPCMYNEISHFNNGIAVVDIEGETGFVDVNGKSTFDYQK